jgi:hypothetical protein
MQQSCKHDTAARNRGLIQDGVQYSVVLEVIKRKLHTVEVQFTTRRSTESRVSKREVKIRLPGRAVQNTEIRRLSLVYVL